MATEIWVSIGSSNGLLPDGTKPLPDPMLTDQTVKSSDIHIRAIFISQEMHQPSTTKLCLKITCLKFHSNFQGAIESSNFMIYRAIPLLILLQRNFMSRINTALWRKQKVSSAQGDDVTH